MRQPSNRAAWASNDDYTVFSLAVILIGLAFGAWMLWHFRHGEISAIAMRAGHSQMRLIRVFTDRFDQADAQVEAANPYAVTFWQLEGLYRDIGRFFLIPAVALVLLLGAVCFLRAAPARFCRKLDLEGLIREQARSFRSIAAHVGRRLRLVSIREGEPRPADPALNAGEWIARWATGRNGGFHEAAARAELVRQLGPVWRNPLRAPPHVRCMLAVFVLHAAQRREEALKLLGDLAESLPAGRKEGRAGPERPLAFPAALVAVADRWLYDPEVAQPSLAIAAHHGFTAPALMSVLTNARLRSGVLAPAQFACLKLVDRRLWYALHSLGFPSEGLEKHPHPNPRIEAIGARDHWATECVAGRPFLTPMIDRAVSAIRAAACETATNVKLQEAA
jgi:intracellular multiplication protein IcmP